MDTIREACNINYWGMNYYNVDENGDIYVCPNPEKPENRVALTKLVEQVQQQKSAHLPTLFVFLKLFNTVCVQLMLLLHRLGLILGMKAIISWFIRLK